MLTANFQAYEYQFVSPMKLAEVYGDFSPIQPIDAPEVIAAGSHVWYDFVNFDGGTPLPSCVSRDQ